MGFRDDRHQPAGADGIEAIAGASPQDHDAVLGELGSVNPQSINAAGDCPLVAATKNLLIANFDADGCIARASEIQFTTKFFVKAPASCIDGAATCARTVRQDR